MKLPKRPKQVSKLIEDLEKSADHLGQTYKDASEEEKAAQAKKAGATEAIKNEARANGVKEGSKTVIKGKRFEVGFISSSSTYIDEEAALKVLKPDILKEIFVTPKPVPFIDEKKFLALVDAGKITKADADKIVKTKAGTDRVHVREIQ